MTTPVASFPRSLAPTARRESRLLIRRRVVGAASLALLGAAIVILTFVAGLVLAGDRLLVVGSGSMAPAIHTGDLVIARNVSIADVEPGAIITFPDPSRNGHLVTHRLVSKVTEADGIHVVTKGDANDVGEDWWIAPDGRVGELRAHVPVVGRVVGAIFGPIGISAALLAVVVTGGWFAIRRIWQD